MSADGEVNSMGPMATTLEEKYELITRNLQEVVGEDALKKVCLLRVRMCACGEGGRENG
jgi:hypothetical protein